jgi:hypothetical protein
MLQAQVTAWSERRSQPGASVVIIGVPPPAGCCGAVNVSTAEHTDTDAYVPLFWRLDGVDTGWSVDNYRLVGEGVTRARAAAGNGVPPPLNPRLATKTASVGCTKPMNRESGSAKTLLDSAW